MIPFSWSNPYAWPRKPLLSQNVVATSQPFAAGGNAVDAILATAITVSLVEPVPNGIGSDAYALVFYGWGARGGFPMKEFSAYTAWQERMMKRLTDRTSVESEQDVSP
jgi:gamma-glutamyltranspeptidase